MTSINELKQIAKAKKMTYKEIAERCSPKVPQLFTNFLPTKIPRKKPRLFGAFVFGRTPHRDTFFRFLNGRQSPEPLCVIIYRSCALATFLCDFFYVHAHLTTLYPGQQ